jgi:hypothetical protein
MGVLELFLRAVVCYVAFPARLHIIPNVGPSTQQTLDIIERGTVMLGGIVWEDGDGCSVASKWVKFSGTPKSISTILILV